MRGYRSAGNVSSATGLVKPVLDENASTLYKADIKIFNKRYSGLLLVKKTDVSTSHLSFVSEIGMKIFDFEIRPDTFRLTYIFEPLNKPRIINLLQNDMKLLMLQELLNHPSEKFIRDNDVAFYQNTKQKIYYLAGDDGRIDRLYVKGFIFRKMAAEYIYRDSLAPFNIRLKHKGFTRIQYKFNRLEKTKP